MKFDIVKTNIINVAADAVVLPANEHLKEGSGASQAIFEAAGRSALTKYCDKLGHCDIGNAVPTPAFKLPAKYIIHAVVPRWIDGSNDEYSLLSSAYLSALNIADVMRCESIVFPLLASGNNGFDKELAIHIANESIEHFTGINLKKVTIVIYGDNTEELVKSLGYSVMDIPYDILKNGQKAEHKDRAKKLLSDGKDVAQQFVEDQIAKGLEWLKNKENREKVLKCAFMIVQLAITAKKKHRNDK